MDWISISTGCFAASNAISKTEPALRRFIREVREARPELDAVLAEISSLDGVLDILKDDASSFPGDLARRTPPLLEHCTSIINQIEGYMHVCNGLGLSKREKKLRWMAIRSDMEKLRLTLEGYKSTLAVVTDLIGLTKTRKENNTLSISSDDSRYHDAVDNQNATNDDIKSDLARAMAGLGGLRGRLQGDFRSNYAISDLESYLDVMQLHATNLGYRLEAERLEAARPPRIPTRAARRTDRDDRYTISGSGSSSAGDTPDSAIDMNDGPPSPYRRIFLKEVEEEPVHPALRKKSPSRRDRGLPSLPILEIDELLDELDQVADLPETLSRPPTPPPKARGRCNSVLTDTTDHLSPFTGGQLPGLDRPQSARSLSDYGVLDSEGNPIVPRRISSIRSLSKPDGEGISTPGSLRGVGPPRSESNHYSYSYSYANTNANTNAGATTNHYRNSIDSTVPPAIRDVRPPSRASRILDKLTSLPVRPGTSWGAVGMPSAAPGRSPTPAHGRKDSIDTALSCISGGGSKSGRPSTARSLTTSSIRSGGSRLSSVFRRVSIWQPRISEDEKPAEDPEPDDIFGVSLRKSMQMASATVKTYHNGSKASSRREFPRCILLCSSFIKDNDGVCAPHIFGGEGGLLSGGGDSMMRVAALKESFSTAPYYGEGNIDWADYDVYDAAELIVLFLQKLPKPLISETVAKRWVMLSKQATLPGSMGLRIDHCIDFWDEALLGVRGPARSLFKLLLNLWGDIADAADINDMTAERLAARLLNPLMHLPAGKYTTDFMLGLAFLIRKRSEYSMVLRDGRKSKAAFEV